MSYLACFKCKNSNSNNLLLDMWKVIKRYKECHPMYIVYSYVESELLNNT